MVIGSKEALGRLHSSDNLINRLTARRNAMGLFGVGSASPKDKIPVPTDLAPAVPAALVPAPAPFVNPFEKKVEPELEAADKPPSLDTLVGNAEVQIKLAQAHDLSLNTLVSAVETLATKLDDIKPEKLAGVITATSKVVDQIQKQRIDASKARSDQVVHLHFYTPVQRRTEEYEVIDVN